MRAIVTGQVGMDKKNYLEKVVAAAADHGQTLTCYHMGDLMYAEAQDVRPGRILDLPLSRLNALRRAVMKDILRESTEQEHALINTHATFRWRHGLFAAFDFDQLHTFKPDILICLVDNIEVVSDRLHRDHTIDATLKDMMVWREEEIMATELLAQALGCSHQCYVLSRGRHQDTTETCHRLLLQPKMRKVYPSFPMSHVVDMPEILKEIDTFRDRLAEHFIAFDPGDVDEKLLLDRAIDASKQHQDFVESQTYDAQGKPQTISVSVKQILDIAGDVDGQIYARDFKLIDQSDMIVSLIPELSSGIPGLSSGVERELQHAFEHGKEVYVVWKPKKAPSPFITETATKMFATTDEAMDHFKAVGMIGE